MPLILSKQSSAPPDDPPVPKPAKMLVGRDISLQELLGPMVLLLVITLTALAGDAGREALQFDRAAIANGEYWRLLGGNFVHATWYHWLLNALGLVIYMVLCPEPLPLRWWLLRALVLGLAVGLGIWWFVPGVDVYWGLSGAQHGIYLLGFWHHLRLGDRLLWLALLYLVGKLLWEQFGGAPVSNEAAIGARVLTESHMFGFLGGVLYLALFGWAEGLFGKRSDKFI